MDEIRVPPEAVTSICGAVSPGGTLCGYAPHTAGLHSWEGIREPVDKGFREEFVAADQDLYWLAGRGALRGVAAILHERRALIEEGRELVYSPGNGGVELTEGDVRRLAAALAESAAQAASHIDHITSEESRHG